MLGYSYEIIYKPGAQNRVADALSRVHDPLPQLRAITVPHWDFLQKLLGAFKEDPTLEDLLLKVQQHLQTYPHFQVFHGLLFFKGKLFVPSNSSLKNVMLEEFHSSPLGGHSGISKTYGRLKENVYWEGMKNDVVDFVKACHTCQQIKNTTHLPYDILQPLPIPQGV